MPINSNVSRMAGNIAVGLVTREKYWDIRSDLRVGEVAKDALAVAEMIVKLQEQK